MKICRVCHEDKEDSQFYKRLDPVRAKSDPCRECTLEGRRESYAKNPEKHSKEKKQYRDRNPEKIRDTKLKQAYGVGIDYFNAKLKEQGGVCAGCQKDVKTVWKGKVVNMALDHDHATGKVRGVLCLHCNRALGSLKEDPNTLLNLVDYIRKYKKLG